MSLKLNSIELKGYKSVNSEGQTLPVNDDITVLIGANGVGKSNIVSFFQLLNYSMSGSLQTYIGENGFADAFLYYGSKTTDSFSAKLKFSDGKSSNEYVFQLANAVGDSMFFRFEDVTYSDKEKNEILSITLGQGHKESRLSMEATGHQGFYLTDIAKLLSDCRYFQFHDTTKEAKIRKNGYIGDNKFLRSNAGNLAAFLYGVKHQQGGEPYYRRIVRYIQQVMPQFGDFILEPSVVNKDYISLDWREKDSDFIFGVNQISDGTLRFMALATLLLQPPKTMPSLIVIDEPELGLHPKAISLLAGLIKKVSENAQIVLATQSPNLLDEFDADKVVVIERDEQQRTSIFKQLSSEQLKEWVEEYTTSELWDKNVIGGRP